MSQQVLNVLKRFLYTAETQEKLNAIADVMDTQTHQEGGGVSQNGNEKWQNLIQKHIVVTPLHLDNVQDSDKCILGGNLLSDLEVLKPYQDSNNSKTIYNVCCAPTMLGTAPYLQALLQNPISNVDSLLKRQQVLKSAIHKLGQVDPKVLQSILEKLQEHEKDVLWMIDNHIESDSGANIESQSSLFDMAYFTFIFLRHLNKQDKVLTGFNLYRIIVSPLVGLLTPITYVIVPYLVLRYKLKINVGLVTYIKLMLTTLMSGDTLFMGSSKLHKLKWVSVVFSILFYFQSVFNNFEISKALYKIAKLLVSKINGMVNFMQAAKQYMNAMWDPSIKTAFHLNISDQQEAHVNWFSGFKTTGFSLMSNFGRQLKYYKMFKPEPYIKVLQQVYAIDMIHSIVRIASQRHFVFTELVAGSQVPELALQDFWHPCLDSENVVKNSITMGDSVPNNIMLTGPNAGGKSTIIKSVLSALLFSQTFTLCNASYARLTPFAFMNSQINIPDCKGEQSLFEAEMYRSRDNLRMLKSLALTQDGQPNARFSFIAMDEIFNSTNPIEGIAGAYAICKNMASYPHSMSIISTHYLYLCKLAKDIPSCFKNYKMNVNYNESTKEIMYPYRLTPGISRQYIALELLRLNGFEDDVIQEALTIKHRLLKP
jgi:hypothetical protein